MTSLLTKLWTKFSTRKVPFSIMLVGLDNSGKTSVLNRLVSTNSVVNQEVTQNLDSVDNQSGVNSFALSQTNEPESLDLETRAGYSPSSPCQARPSMRALVDHSSQSPDHLEHNIIDDRLDKSLMCSDTRSIMNMTSTKTSRGANIMPTVGYNYERVQYKNVSITVLDFSGQTRYRNLWQEFYNGVDAIVFVVDSSDLIRFAVARDELESLINHPYFSSLSRDTHPSRLLSDQILPLPCDRQQKQITVSQGKLIQEPLYASSSSSPAAALIASTPGKFMKKLVIKQRDSGRHLACSSTIRQRVKVPILFLANKSDLPNSVEAEVISKALNLSQVPIDRHPWTIQATSVSSNQGIDAAFDWLVSQLLSVS